MNRFESPLPAFGHPLPRPKGGRAARGGGSWGGNSGRGIGIEPIVLEQAPARCDREAVDRHSHLAAYGMNVFFVAPFTRREDSARFFAAKYTAENVTVAAHPAVNLFGEPDNAGNP